MRGAACEVDDRSTAPGGKALAEKSSLRPLAKLHAGRLDGSIRTNPAIACTSADSHDIASPLGQPGDQVFFGFPLEGVVHSCAAGPSDYRPLDAQDIQRFLAGDQAVKVPLHIRDPEVR